MQHIVILGKYYPPEFGGVERYTRDVARIAAKRHRVTVVVHNIGRKDHIETDGEVKVIRCGTAKIVKAQPISPSMLRHLRSLQPDLVHFNAPNFWAAGMLLLASYKAPLIITHHADVFGRRVLKHAVMPLYRHHVRRAQAVAVTSRKNAALSTDLPPNTSHVVEIPWGVDQSKYVPLDEALRPQMMAERQQRFGAGPIVGFVGRFVRYKALPVLIEALTRLPEVRAVLVGDGPLRSQVEQQAKAAGLMERMHFLGGLDEQSKINVMKMMDMLVLPSNETTEAFGIAQVEAHLLGLPVIATNLPTGVTDITLDGQTGLLVPPDDPQGIADAITRLVDNPVYARDLGANGRQRALRHFTLEAFEHKWTRLIDAVLAGQRVDELAQLTTATAYQLPTGF